jgi:group II intron reverse transcriptase/maturase
MQMELPFRERDEVPQTERSGEASAATSGDGRSGTDHLMEEVVSRDNLKEALRRVRANKGSPGIDGMTVEELPAYLKANWPRLRAELLAGDYQPQPVRQKEIPKASGGVRKLGIPTVVDRFLQQAILQVLGPRFDPTFSEHSYGFRPGRRAHDAVCAAQRHIQEGRDWVVDVDLEQFFDRVNHDVMMGKLATRIVDRRLLGLIRRYLEAGVLANGLATERHEGTPQGGPLSPLLANVLLDEVDKELERRGHAFARYADDCNVYVRSRRAGERVMAALRRKYAALRLRVNESKSAVARPWDRKFLGYSFWRAKDGTIKRRIAEKALDAMKERVRQITARSRGRNLDQVIADLRAYLVGWKTYFNLTELRGIFREVDQWIRRRLRMVQLKLWKRGSRVFRALCALGAPSNAAASAAAHAKRLWHTSRHPALNIALSPTVLDRMGLPRLAT